MGLGERLDKVEESILKLNEMFEQPEKKKDKKFKIPFGKKVGKSQKKKNYVTLVKLYENRTADFKKVQIEDQSFMENDIPRLAYAGHVFIYKKNPFIFLPNWSVMPVNPDKPEETMVKPFSTEENQEESMKDRTNINGYKVLLAAMENAKADMKKKLQGTGKWLGIGLGILIVGVIVYAVVSGGGHP